MSFAVATDEIRESLKNEDMQKLIYKIDKSADAESVIFITSN